jgi:glutamate decarboxylase
MVHLNRVATDKEVQAAKGLVDGMKKFTLAVEDEPEDYTATVYGSKYAAEDLPRHEMPVRRSFLPLPIPPNLTYSSC